MFMNGTLADFTNPENIRESTLGEKFPSRQYSLLISFRVETYELLTALLRLDPHDRLSAKEALNFEYFYCQPSPAEPNTKDFPGFNSESHEYESRKLKVSRMKQGGRVHLPNHHDAINFKTMNFQ